MATTMLLAFMGMPGLLELEAAQSVPLHLHLWNWLRNKMGGIPSASLFSNPTTWCIKWIHKTFLFCCTLRK